MDEDKQREIAKKGGQASHGGNDKSSHSSQGKENPGNFANDREKAREAGRKGGEARGNNDEEE